MPSAVAFPILALTLGLSLARPRVGRFRISPPTAAVIGAILTLLLGVIPPQSLVHVIDVLFFPIVTIISLMVITLIAEQAGLFNIIARSLSKTAGGDGRKLFTQLFFTGTVTGTIFTNDAAVLILTPLVFNLVESIKKDSWDISNKLPYYFAVLYVANLVGGLVISNPINIIVSSIFEIGFAEYAKWMVIPSVVSIVVSFVGLRFFFRASIPEHYMPLDHVASSPANQRFMAVSGFMLCLALVGFFSESFTRIPTWLVALACASVLLAIHSVISDAGLAPIIRGVGWDVIIFVVGIFIVVTGIRMTGFTDVISMMITNTAGQDLSKLTFGTALIAAVCSSIINNHPTSYMMAGVVQDLGLTHLETRMAVFSALIGGDVGPKMIPIGSLAALMWFRILRNKGVEIPYTLYVRIGVPVTLGAVVLSVAALNALFWLYGMLGL